MASFTQSVLKEREQWSSQFGFLMAAIGSAVGLGNIWRFPGIAYKNGGGAFIIPYLFALIVAGITVLLLDYAVGNRYKGSPPVAFRRINRRAEILGWWQVAICFVIMIYYAAIIGWSGSYVGFSVTQAWGQDSGAFFMGDFLQVPDDPTLSTTPVLWVALPLALVWVVVIAILAFGVQRGVERSAKVFMPVLVVIFLAMVIRALTLPGAVDGLNAFFKPNWEALFQGEVWLAAFAQIFYSLSVAFGIMLTYASYLPKRANLAGTGLVAAFANSAFELLAGIGVFSALGFMAHEQGVKIEELDSIMGVSLSFITFPKIISMMPGGSLFGILFFGSLVLAGITSLISLIQVVSSAFQDKFNLSPAKAAVSVGIVSAAASLFFFGTKSALLVLDTVDNYINMIGVTSSAILVCVILAVGTPVLPILRRHINSMSTIKIGVWWDVTVGYIVPAVLGSMLMTQIVTLVSDGYGGYPTWFTNSFGWGCLAFAVVAAIALTVAPWKRDVDGFTPLPLPEVKETVK